MVSVWRRGGSGSWPASPSAVTWRPSDSSFTRSARRGADLPSKRAVGPLLLPPRAARAERRARKSLISRLRAWHRACHLKRAMTAAKSGPRWRVVVIDDHAPSRAALRSAVTDAGGEVVGEAQRAADAMATVTRAQPDVAIFAVGLPDGDGVATAAAVTTAASCPVVLFTSHTQDDLVARAQAAGVMAYLVKPLRPAELAPALDLAIARFRETRELKQTLEERKVIERAKGRLMDRLRLTEEEAFRRLRRAAMNSRRPMVEIARAVLVSESVTEDLPAI